MRTHAAGVALVLALVSLPALAAAPAVERTLPSGARALFVTRPGSGTVLTAVAVTAGAEDEPKEHAGLSHFLEHLLFDGYDALDERGVTEAFERHAIYANAFTRGQATIFIALAPKDEAKTASEMLLGMLTRSTITPAAFEKEKKVILEELARDRSTPNGARDEALRAALWAGSPLEHAQGGTAEGVAAITREDVLAFWHTHYVPKEFRVLVIGDAPVEELETIAAPYASAEGGATAPATRAAAPTRAADSTYPGWGTWRASQPFLADDPQLQLVIAPPAGTSIDAATLDRLADWLGDERGPLAAALQPNVARRIGVSRSARAPRDLLEVSIEAAKDRSAKDVLDATLAALDAAAAGPTDDEAERFAHAAVAQRAVEGQRLHYIAMLYGETFATLAGPLLPAIEPPRAGGPAVRAAAASLLGAGVRARTRAAWSGPDGPEAPSPLPQQVAAAPAAKPGDAKPEAGPAGSRVVTLPSGLVVAVLEEPGSSVFGVQVLAVDRALREPADKPGVVDLAHRLVGAGTKLSPGAALASRLQRLGLELKTADDPNIPYDDEDDVPDYSYLRLEGPATSLDEGLALLGEMLRQPDWDRAGWERAVASHEQERKVLAQGSLATSRTLRARVLGAAHPLAKALAAPVGAPLPTEDDVRALFGTDMYFDPSRMIVAVVAPRGAGDVAARLADVLGGTSKAAPARGPYPAPSPSAPEAKPAGTEKPAEAAKPAEMPKPPAGMPGGMPGMPPGMGGTGKPQVTLAWGRVADVPAAERAPLALALSALSDRMVAVIREKEGLAYRLGAGARALPSGGWLLSASVGTRPQNEERVRQLFGELTAALGSTPLPAPELERLAARARQKDMLAGLSAGQRASRLARLVFEGNGSPLGVGYADVRRVTPAQLQAAAAKWLAAAGWLSVR